MRALIVSAFLMLPVAAFAADDGGTTGTTASPDASTTTSDDGCSTTGHTSTNGLAIMAGLLSVGLVTRRRK